MPAASKPVLAAAACGGLLLTASTAARAFTVGSAPRSPTSLAQLRGYEAFEKSPEAIADGTTTSQLPLAAGVGVAFAVAAGVSSKRRTRMSRAAKTCCRAVAVGAEVVWNGKEGTVRYVGSTKFAPGEWVGVELKSAGGMHNGTVMGVSYFECPEGCGVFTQQDQLAGGAAAPAPAAPAAAPAVSAPAATATASAIAVGSTLSWNGKQGTVRYVGSTKFAPGEWVGLELAGGGGMHDGTVMGTKYFECPAGSGVFAPAAQLAGGAAPAPAAAPAAAAAPTSTPASAPAASGSISVGAKVSWNGKAGTVRYVGGTKFAGGQWVGVELDSDGGMHDGSVMGVSYFTCAPGRGIFAPESALSVLAAA